MKTTWIALLIIMLASCAHPQIRTAPWDTSVSGAITDINKDDFRFIVNHLNPDTGVTSIFQFKTDSSTHYDHAAGFSDLAIGDWAVVEFLQNQKGEFIAQNITLRKKAPEALAKKSDKRALLG